MSRAAIMLGSSLLGLGLCWLIVWLSSTLGIAVQFPSPGGEDDFSIRAAYFIFGVCPAFLVLGAWIGYISAMNRRCWILMWSGTLAGTLVVWVGIYLLRSKIESLSGDHAGTHAVLVFYGLWVLLSGLGAAVAHRSQQA